MDLTGIAVEFSKDVFEGFLKPGVYILADEFICLYIDVLKHACDFLIVHDRIYSKKAFNQATKVYFIPCKSSKDAKELKEELILKFNPTCQS